MPPVSANTVRTRFSLAALNVTVNVRFFVPLSPSVTLGELTDSDGKASSSRIVPVPDAVEMLAFVGPLNCTTTVWCGSSVVSPRTCTVTVLLVSPAANVNVPEGSAV